MSGVIRIFGITAIIFCALTLYGSLEQSGCSGADDPLAVLNDIRHSLAGSGLHERDDVSIEINGREVALAFSRPGCDGLMLVAFLPHTAQGWAHMAPRLDLSMYRLGYLYDGAAYRSVPRLERLADRLRRDLRPYRARIRPQVIAIAEAGNCGLAPIAATALEAVSKGQTLPVELPEPNATLEDISV